jgi:hypothetical protein
MTRPRGETPESLKNRDEIAAHVLRANAARYDGWINLEAMLYRVDCCFWQKQHWYQVPRLFFEAKQRTTPFGHFRDGLAISVGKIVAAQYLTKATGLPCAFFGRWSDGVVAGVDLAKQDNCIVIGGRTDRIDLMGEEIEPMMLIPWPKFKIIPDVRSEAA